MSERLRAQQVAVMADAVRLRLLARIITAPTGQAGAADLAEPGTDPQHTRQHLELMAEVGLVVPVGFGPDVAFRPSHDALARFGGWVIEQPGAVQPTDPGDHRRFLRHLAADLAEQYHEILSPDTVARFVEESYRLLASRARIRRHLPGLTARFASERLAALATPAVTPGGRDVLFVCQRNAGRSQVAAALMRQRAADRVRVRTAGTVPARALDPQVLAELRRRGLDQLAEFPRPLTEEVVRASSVVVTMGCGDACPVLPGRRYLDWTVRDPAGAPAHVVRQIVDDISVRVDDLLDELGSRAVGAPG